MILPTPGKVIAPPPETSLVMSPQIASSAALADFLSVPISSDKAATSCVFVIGFDIFFSLLNTQ